MYGREFCRAPDFLESSICEGYVLPSGAGMGGRVRHRPKAPKESIYSRFKASWFQMAWLLEPESFSEWGVHGPFGMYTVLYT